MGMDKKTEKVGTAAALGRAAHNARAAQKRKEKTVARLVRDQWMPKNWRKLERMTRAENAQPTLSVDSSDSQDGGASSQS